MKYFYVFLMMCFWVYMIFVNISSLVSVNEFFLSLSGAEVYASQSFVVTLSFAKMLFLVFGCFVLLPSLIEWIFSNMRILTVFYATNHEYIFLYSRVISFTLGIILLIIGGLNCAFFGFLSKDDWKLSLTIALFLLLIFWFYLLVFKKK